MYGFIRGLLFNNTSILPLPEAVSAELNYTSNLREGKAFNPSSGILQVVRACRGMESATIKIGSETAPWSFIQAALGYRSANSSLPYIMTETFTPTSAQVTGGNTTVTVGTAPIVGANTPVRAARVVGGEPVVVVSNTGTSVVLTGDLSGIPVQVSYWLSTARPEIRVGSGIQIPNSGIYGVFKACDRSYALMANNAQIVADFKLSASDGVEVSEISCNLLTDAQGDLFRLLDVTGAV